MKHFCSSPSWPLLRNPNSTYFSQQRACTASLALKLFESDVHVKTLALGRLCFCVFLDDHNFLTDSPLRAFSVARIFAEFKPNNAN
jgi:hypothetical protein